MNKVAPTIQGLMQCNCAAAPPGGAVLKKVNHQWSEMVHHLNVLLAIG